ncbi:MAG: GntR family transcriptional regulator [Planctomycetota bacterium]|jgi:GntR family transcriptional regulator
MTYRVDQSSSVSPSRQLVEAVLDAVSVGSLAPGDKLLSVRALAAEALVNPNTAARAYRDLELMGVVEGRNGRGVFVTAQGPGIARGMRVKATFDAFRRAAAEALRAGHDAAALRAVLDASGKTLDGSSVQEVE